MKFFPPRLAEASKMLKAMSAPYRHLGIGFIPTGGISASNAIEYLSIDNVLAVGGTWLAPNELVKTKQWGKIEDIIKRTADAINI